MQPTIEELLLIIKNQQVIIERLEARVIMLEQELSYYRNRKNSNNSHVPPSKYENRPLKNQSLREKSDKKPGGKLTSNKLITLKLWYLCKLIAACNSWISIRFAER